MLACGVVDEPGTGTVNDVAGCEDNGGAWGHQFGRGTRQKEACIDVRAHDSVELGRRVGGNVVVESTNPTVRELVFAIKIVRSPPGGDLSTHLLTQHC